MAEDTLKILPLYRSKVLAGLWLKVDWLWQEPLPPLLTILREWKLIS